MGSKTEGVGVTTVKDKEVDLEETEVSLTLGGTGEGHVQVRGTWRGCKCYSVVR